MKTESPSQPWNRVVLCWVLGVSQWLVSQSSEAGSQKKNKGCSGIDAADLQGPDGPGAGRARGHGPGAGRAGGQGPDGPGAGGAGGQGPEGLTIWYSQLHAGQMMDLLVSDICSVQLYLFHFNFFFLFSPLPIHVVLGCQTFPLLGSLDCFTCLSSHFSLFSLFPFEWYSGRSAVAYWQTGIA